jgi:hypothetical protein
MDVSASGTDFPTKFDVDKSNDGTTWTSVETNITGAQYNVHNFSSPFTCRYIRFVVSTISSGHNWQITNLNLFDDKIQTAETVGSSSSSFSGSAGKALTVRGVFARSTQNHDLGFRVGVDSSNWYGFQCVGTGVRIKRSIAGTVTDLVTHSTSQYPSALRDGTTLHSRQQVPPLNRGAWASLMKNWTLRRALSRFSPTG